MTIYRQREGGGDGGEGEGGGEGGERGRETTETQTQAQREANSLASLLMVNSRTQEDQKEKSFNMRDNVITILLLYYSYVLILQRWHQKEKQLALHP